MKETPWPGPPPDRPPGPDRQAPRLPSRPIRIAAGIGGALVVLVVAFLLYSGTSGASAYKQLGQLSQNDTLWSVAFNPNGRLLVSAGDFQARVWDVRTRTELGKPIACSDPIEFSRDGRLACPPVDKYGATFGNNDPWLIQFWNPGRGKRPIETMRGPGLLSATALSLNGRVLATAVDDNRVRLYDTHTHRQIGKPLLSFPAGEPGIAFSPDGRVLAIVGSRHVDQVIRLWNLRQQRLAAVLDLGNIDSADASTLAFSPDGRLLASAQAGTVRLWNVRTHRQVGPALLSCSEWNTLAFRPDGHFLAANCGGEVRFWNVRTHKQIGAPLATSRVYDLAFSPNGRILATASADQTARLWNVANIARSAKR